MGEGHDIKAADDWKHNKQTISSQFATFQTPNPPAVGESQSSDGFSLFEGAYRFIRDVEERSHEKSGERADNHWVKSYPYILDETVPEEEGVLLSLVDVKEERTDWNIHQKPKHEQSKAIRARVKLRAAKAHP